MLQERRRLLIFTAGILILTFGIALTIRSNLGTTPFDAVLVGLYRTVGLTVGSWEIVLGLIMVLGNAAVQRVRPEYLAMFTALVTGMGIDFWLFTLSNLHPGNIFMQILCLLTGLLFAGFGIALYLQADYAPNPMDRSMLVIHDRTRLNIAQARTIISIVLVVFAFFLQGPIGIGTIIAAFFHGMIIKCSMKYIKDFAKRKADRTESLSS
jgi:uncharacterized membrane protein YczE